MGISGVGSSGLVDNSGSVGKTHDLGNIISFQTVRQVFFLLRRILFH